MTVFGIIGVGSIASAIVTGLCEDVGEPPQVVLSPRGQARSNELAARFRTVTIASTNQQFLDQSDVDVLCVLPHQAEEALGQLVFEKPGESSVPWPESI